MKKKIPFIRLTTYYIAAAIVLFTGQVFSQVQSKLNGPANPSPSGFDLDQNKPNPFLTNTTIKYYLKNTTDVSLKVYNLLGKELATLVNQKQLGGHHNVVFNAAGLSEGVYYYQIKIDGVIETRRMIISK